MNSIKSLILRLAMIFVILGMIFPVNSFGQSLAKLNDPYPGAGVMTAGDLWETFLPSWAGSNYQEIKDDPNRSHTLIRVGNLERQWSSPTQMYPSGDDIHIPWKQIIEMIEYTPGINNFTTSTDPRAKDYVYGFETTKLNLPAPYNVRVKTATANWVDPNTRSQQLYESSGPTNLGLYVKVRARQWTINHANVNDFIALEIELTNTGVLDADGNGTPEKTNNRINCLVLNMRSEPINSMSNSTAGTRGTNGWFTGPTTGYDGSPDADGYPWDVPVNFTGPAPAGLTQTQTFTTPSGKQATILWAPNGARDLGNTMVPRRYYQDIYTGHQWIAAKKGALPTGSSFSQEDKKTIYDSPPVGTGPQRGWYTSVSRGYGNDDHFAHINHILSMGAFYDNGGRIFDANQITNGLTPDPNYFDITKPFTAGDPLSFIGAVKPEGQRGRPDGSMKYSNQWTQNWERNNPNPADDWTEGYSRGHGFDGDFYVGIGPFSLEPGETINLVLVEYGGFRLQGVRQARKSAQWAYDNNWNVPQPPPMPNVKIEPSVDVKVNVKWDNVAESAADFAGYKIYRVTAFPRVNSLEVGRRVMDHYHEQTVEKPTDAQLAALGVPNNPNISPPANFYQQQTTGPWGPWKLVKNIPKAQLNSYLNPGSDAGQYKYVFKDTDDLVQFGFTYWYYVAAYDNESGSIGGKPFTSLETHRINWNGSAGLWQGTYHFATASPFFPKTLDGLSKIGANYVLSAPLAPASALADGTLKIRVKPNPYKLQALHDVNLEHKILFFNLPTGTRITILDVSGQVIDVLEFTGTNPNDGTVFWDMFSKDGVEVTSGLYIYVAEYPGGKQVGHFSILR